MVRRPDLRRRWLVASVLLVAANVLLLGYHVGVCTDYAPEPGAESTCTSGPILGVAGTWAIGILSLFALAYFLYRHTRRPGSR